MLLLVLPKRSKLGGGQSKLELCQLWRSVRQRLLRLLLHRGDALLLKHELIMARKPLKIFLLALLLNQQGFLFVSKRLQTLLQLLLLLFAQQHDARRLRLALFKHAAGGFVFLKHHGGNLAVDLGAGQFFQQLGAIARLGIKEGGKLPL